MSVSMIGVDSLRAISGLPLDKAVNNRAVLAVVAIAGVILGDGLFVAGLVGLGVIALPFIWPVALGVLSGAAIIAAIAFVALPSLKVEEIQMDGIDPSLDLQSFTEFEQSEDIEAFVSPEEQPIRSNEEWIKERQQVFLNRAIDAKDCFLEGGQIGDNAVQYLVLALTIKYNKSCNLKVSGGKPFDEFNYCQKLNNGNQGLHIRTVCIDPQEGPQKYFRWLEGVLTGNRVCLEPHASVFLKGNGNNWEYFDPKFNRLHDGLTEAGKTVESLVKGKITEYRNLKDSPTQVQSTFNSIDCGIHVCRRIEQYFEGKAGERLPVLTKDELNKKREEFSQLIIDRITKEN